MNNPSIVPFKFYPDRSERLTAEFVRDEYRRISDRIAQAEEATSPEGWLAIYADWNGLTAYCSGEGSRIGYRLAKSMNDPEAEEADRYFREEISPVISDGESVMVTSLLASRHRDAVADRYGAHLLRQLATNVESVAPINRDLRVAVSTLSKRYMKHVAAGEVQVNGETLTLAMAGSYALSDDESLRRESFMAIRGWFLTERDELAQIYHEMVAIRTTMARNLGHENFVPLGYLGRGRTDYGPEEAATFRESVRRYAVPIMAQLREEMRLRLGLETLRPWNAGYDPEVTLPRGVAPIDQQLDRAQEIFEELSPRLSGHFRRMRDEGLIDLENRRGKQSGAFCTTFMDEGRPAILCNSTGDSDDVRTLLHEMGHAFQKWESEPIDAVVLQVATADAAEIHSMGMEYLTLPYIDKYFDAENAAKFRSGRWKKAIVLVCYCAVVDEFQHWVYEHPDATPDERDQAWIEISDRYDAGVDYSGIEEYRATRWYQQHHIFRAPFYYIDYALAEIAAMQLALIDARDHDKAVETYMELCRIGGTKSVLDIIASAGLRSPFDPELMKDLMEHAVTELSASPSPRIP